MPLMTVKNGVARLRHGRRALGAATPASADQVVGAVQAWLCAQLQGGYSPSLPQVLAMAQQFLQQAGQGLDTATLLTLQGDISAMFGRVMAGGMAAMCPTQVITTSGEPCDWGLPPLVLAAALGGGLWYIFG